MTCVGDPDVNGFHVPPMISDDRNHAFNHSNDPNKVVISWSFFKVTAEKI